MHEYFFCTVGDAIRCFIAKEGYKARVVKKVFLAKPRSDIDDIINGNTLRNIKQIDTLRILTENTAGMTCKEIMSILGLKGDSVVKTLIKKGLVRIEEEIQLQEYNQPVDVRGMNTYEAHVLRSEQQKAHDFIVRLVNNGKFAECLLHGVTGSGKTEVYMQIISKVMEKGSSSMVLVPEIALTPQMIANFTARFGNTVAVLHSKLTDSQRGTQWQRIRNQEVRIIIGTRSAVFAPVKNLSIIIIDEEHDTSYYSEEANPHYDAREVAVMRAKQENAVVLYGSATPSVKTFYRAVNHDMYYMALKSRANNKPLPQCCIYDMRQKRLSGMGDSIICDDMKTEIIKNYAQGLQTMVFVHRRGYSGQVMCAGCLHKYDFYWKLLVAFIPAAVLGLLFSDMIDAMLESVTVVATTLILGGIFMLFCDKIFNKGNDDTELTEKRAFWIGMFQCISMIPGVSRSMATIVGGMAQKLSRKKAAEFSFFLAVPTMFAATLFKMLKLFMEPAGMEIITNNLGTLLIGNIVAFIVAMLAIKFFISFVTKYGFKAFGWYRIVLGGVILLLLLTGHNLTIA